MANRKAKLTPQQQAHANVASKAKQGIGVTLHTTGKPIKGLLAQPMPKPNAANTRVVAVINGHPGAGNCIKRWHLYRVGQSIMHAITTAGQTPNDLTFWATCKLPNGKPYLVLRPATAQEFAAWQAAYAKAQGKGKGKAQPASAPQASASAPQAKGKGKGKGKAQPAPAAQPSAPQAKAQPAAPAASGQQGSGQQGSATPAQPAPAAS